MRFTCCSSTSTCAKSVFTVRSSARFCVTAYLTSTPASASQSFSTGGATTRSVLMRDVTNGFTSRFNPGGGASIPTRSPYIDTRNTAFGPDPATWIGTAVR